MEWGHAQSVLQLGVAINLIFYSFRDLRMPKVRTTMDLIDDIESECTSLQRLLSVIGKVPIDDNRFSTVANCEMALALESSNALGSRESQGHIQGQAERVDAFAKYWCLGSSCVAAGLLINSTVEYSTALSNGVFSLIALGVFAPIAFSVVYNISYTIEGFHKHAEKKESVAKLRALQAKIVEAFPEKFPNQIVV